MKASVGAKIAAGFGLTILVFVIAGTLSYRATVQLIQATNLRKHTFLVLSDLDDTLALLQDVQLSQRGFVLTGDERDLQPYRAARNAIQPHLVALRTETRDNPSQQRRLEALEPLINASLAFTDQLVGIRQNRGLDSSLALVTSGRDRALMDQIRTLVTAMRTEEDGLLRTRAERAERDAANATRAILWGVVVALAVAVLAGALITRDIAAPLRQLTAVAERITAGDLNVAVPSGSRSDEVGILSRAFERMTRSLKSMARVAEEIAAGDLRTDVKPQSSEDMLGNAFVRMTAHLRLQIRELLEGVNVLGSAVSEIVASTSELAASASESAAAVTETTTTVEEVRQTAELASQKARLVSETAQKSAQISLGGRKAADDVAAGMNRIRQQMAGIGASMGRLLEQSHAIGQIIATVEDISTQSNLLAVNAAIEAAKAGEHGRGFGVVAQEVKSLAEQSRQATMQVRSILGDIQKATTAAVMATEEGSKAVDAGMSQSEAAGASIQALAVSVNEAAQAATQISASSQQQLVGVSQVAGAMESVRQASSQNVESARQMEFAARNLHELGQRLKKTVERYQV